MVCIRNMEPVVEQLRIHSELTNNTPKVSTLQAAQQDTGSQQLQATPQVAMQDRHWAYCSNIILPPTLFGMITASESVHPEAALTQLIFKPVSIQLIRVPRFHSSKHSMIREWPYGHSTVHLGGSNGQWRRHVGTCHQLTARADVFGCACTSGYQYISTFPHRAERSVEATVRAQQTAPFSKSAKCDIRVQISVLYTFKL